MRDTALGVGWSPIHRAATHELVLDRIRDQISHGRLRVGDRLPAERELASGLGVSRVAVREAISVLKALGVARTATGSGPDAGTFLDAAPTDALTRLLELHVMLASVALPDLVNARVALERESCRLAAASSTQQDRAQLRGCLREMADPGVTVGEFNVLDTDFHVLIARSSGSPLLAQMTIALRQSMRGTLLERLTSTTDFAAIQSRLCVEHEGIYDAIRCREALSASDLVEAHIREFYAGADG
jgi:GntR family transcriptional repressor for pyruvate dehydrogenase complex